MTVRAKRKARVRCRRGRVQERAGQELLPGGRITVVIRALGGFAPEYLAPVRAFITHVTETQLKWTVRRGFPGRDGQIKALADEGRTWARGWLGPEVQALKAAVALAA